MLALDRGAGVLRPDLAVHAAARRAEELGAEIRRYEPVERLEFDETGIRISTRNGVHEFDRVLL